MRSLLSLLIFGLALQACAQTAPSNPSDPTGQTPEQAAQALAAQVYECHNAFLGLEYGIAAVNENGAGVDRVYLNVADAKGNQSQYFATVPTTTLQVALGKGVTFANSQTGTKLIARMRGDRIMLSGELKDTMKCYLQETPPEASAPIAVGAL